MKFALIIGVIVIAGLGWYVYQNQEEPVDHAALEQSGGAMTDDNTASDDDTMMEGEADMEAGTDAGMEFPIPDISIEGDPDAEIKTFNVEGFNYGYSQSEIRVQEGDVVTINFSSTEGFHDWVVDEFGAATTRVNAGSLSSVTFVADTAGTYEFYCSVGNHREQGMVGTLIVE